MMLNNDYPDKHAVGVAQLIFAIVLFILATLNSAYMGIEHLLFRSWVIKEPVYLGLVVYLAVVAYKGLRNIRYASVKKSED